MRRGIAIALLVCASLDVASAATPQAHLLYVREAGAEKCPDEAGLREAVAHRLGYDPFAERAPMTVQVAIGRSPRGGLRATIELVDAVGEVTGARVLNARGGDCAELSSTVELAVSLAIDPLSFAREPGTPSTNNGGGDGATAREAGADVARAASGRETEGFMFRERDENPLAGVKRRTLPDARGTPQREPDAEAVEDNHLRVAAAVGGFTTLGSAPNIAFGVTLSGEVARRRWSFALELRFDVPTGGSALGGDYTTGLYLATLVPCLRAAGGTFGVCALGAIGAQVATGANYALSHQPISPFVGLGVRAQMQIKVHKRVGIQIAADVMGALVRTSLDANLVVVYQTPPVSGAFHLFLVGFFR